MATKKKRKSPKHRKPPVPPKFSSGDQVRAKHGVPDPDFPDIPLGGWAGIIAFEAPSAFTFDALAS
ncbi:MAG: hypothetical protein ABSG53_24045, partial [Thermoguttaceae bacterium]